MLYIGLCVCLSLCAHVCVCIRMQMWVRASDLSCFSKCFSSEHISLRVREILVRKKAEHQKTICFLWFLSSVACCHLFSFWFLKLLHFSIIFLLIYYLPYIAYICSDKARPKNLSNVQSMSQNLGEIYLHSASISSFLYILSASPSILCRVLTCYGCSFCLSSLKTDCQPCYTFAFVFMIFYQQKSCNSKFISVCWILHSGSTFCLSHAPFHMTL